MSGTVYNWERLWCQRESSSSLRKSDDFYGLNSRQGADSSAGVPFDSIAHKSCLVLLGEPGIGKTHALKEGYRSVDAQAECRGEQALWLDLGSFASEDRLVRTLFESEKFRTWSAGTHKLHLFLDSLDECLLQMPTVASLLFDELENHPVERLHLRIACRTADWHESYTQELKKVWKHDLVRVSEPHRSASSTEDSGQNSSRPWERGVEPIVDARNTVGNSAEDQDTQLQKPNVHEYVLAPLSRKNIADAAAQNGLDPLEFLAEIERRGALPLALRPVTLKFLLNNYLQSGELPTTRVDLYSKGCLLLCEETNTSRRRSRKTGTLVAQQRLVLASQIAAVTVLANKQSVWTDIDQGDVPEEDVTVSELVRTSERLAIHETIETESSIREVLGTALFSSRGPNRLGWAHQTYAEFLAAWYLAHSDLPLNQFLSLLVDSRSAESKVVPQLVETSVWLASMQLSFFRHMVQCQPFILLSGDIEAAKPEDKKALVTALLNLPDEEHRLLRDPGTFRKYSELAYPGLADQIRPYVIDASQSAPKRLTAAYIADACALWDLSDDLASVVLDPSETMEVRKGSALAVSHIGTDLARTKLKPLAAEVRHDDPDEELKGYALRALWPNCIVAQELFQILTPPKGEDFGIYATFVSYELARHLTPSDLPHALQWARRQTPSYKANFHVSKLINAVMHASWDHLTAPQVGREFAHTILSRGLERYELPRTESTLQQSILQDHEKRRELLDILMSVVLELGREPRDLLRIGMEIVTSQDVLWMLERLQCAKSCEEQIAWAQLTSRVCDCSVREQVEAVYAVCQQHSSLTSEFEWLLKPIELNSREADHLKKQHARIDHREQRQEQQPHLHSAIEDRVSSLLDEFESGDVAAWWQLNHVMTFAPDGSYVDEIEPDLTAMPGWKVIDAKTKGRIITGAPRYLQEQDPAPDKWLGTHTIYRPAYAGYRAFRLLLQEAPGEFDTISQDLWAKWAPILLTYPVHSGKGTDDPDRLLGATVYRLASDSVIKTLWAILGKGDTELDDIFVMEKLRGSWDSRLASVVLTKVQDQKLKPERMGYMLGELLEGGIHEARELAESMLSLPIPTGEPERTRAVRAAYALMVTAPEPSWQVIWSAISRDTQFGQEVILKVAPRPESYGAAVGKRLTDDQIADLYIWLVHQFPYSEDPVEKGPHRISARESVTMWRDALPSQLEAQGTAAACASLRRLVDEFPELPWLKTKLLAAEHTMRRNSWRPPQPGDILQLTRQPGSRLVRSGAELLAVIEESLSRMEVKLHGETPRAPFLWNKTKSGGFWPKHEADFSNWVKCHLEDDLGDRGIIVGREVEIYLGERTDVHVDAVVRSRGKEGYEPVSVIIEVKGCWNRDLLSAMKTQLVDRYLANNRCQHGLYLVAWFDVEQWDDVDKERRCKVPKMSVDEARDHFQTQAAQLSRASITVHSYVMPIGGPRGRSDDQ